MSERIRFGVIGGSGERGAFIAVVADDEGEARLALLRRSGVEGCKGGDGEDDQSQDTVQQTHSTPPSPSARTAR